MDNPEGQVTYPIKIGRLGYLPALAHFFNAHCVFIFAFIIKPYGMINILINQLPIDSDLKYGICSYHNNYLNAIMTENL